MRRRITAFISWEKRVSTGEIDRHRNPIYEWQAQDPLPVYLVAPATRDEPIEAGRPNAIRSGWDIYAPYDCPIEEHDRVTLPNGTTAYVKGEIRHWGDNPNVSPARAREHMGTHFVVERTEG